MLSSIKQRLFRSFVVVLFLLIMARPLGPAPAFASCTLGNGQSICSG
jgi:hypothetical protein